MNPSRSASSVGVCVLLPFYNPDEGHFEACIRSLNDQTFQQFKVIFIDDGGAIRLDDAWFAERATFAHEILRLPRNQGVGGALNAGLKRVDTPLIARMDADDLSSADRFEKQVAFLESHPEVGVVGTQTRRFGNVNATSRMPLHHREMAPLLPFTLPFIHPSIMLRTTAVEGLSYSEVVPGAEGFPLWAAMIHQKVRFANLPEVLYHYRIEGQNTSVLSRNDRVDRFNAFQEETLHRLFGVSREEASPWIQSGALAQLAFSTRTDAPWIPRKELRRFAELLLEWTERHAESFDGTSEMRRLLSRRLFWNAHPLLHRLYKVIFFK